MTDREKAIVMAYTGICTLTGTKFAIFHKYVEDIMGRPIQTIELGSKNVRDEIKEKSEDDFIALCKEDQEQLVTPMKLEKIRQTLDNLDKEVADKEVTRDYWEGFCKVLNAVEAVLNENSD